MNIFESTFEKHKKLILEKQFTPAEYNRVASNANQRMADIDKKLEKNPKNQELLKKKKELQAFLAKLSNKSTEEQLPNLSQTQFKQISSNLSKLMAGDLPSFVSGLSAAIKDPKVQKFLLMAKEDGVSDDDQITVQEGEVQVVSLIPTQNEVFLEKSLEWPLAKQPKNVVDYIQTGKGSMPAIVVSGNYIIDGHHRWSQIYCLNKNATIPIYNVMFADKKDPTTILKKIHLGIAATTGNVPISAGESKDTNLFTVPYNSFKLWIVDKLSANPKTIKAFKSVEKIMRERIGSSKDVTSEMAKENEDPIIKNVIVPYLWTNVEAMQKNRGEYPRNIMPQTEKDTDIGTFINTLKTGNVNVDVQQPEVKAENIFESTFEKHKKLMLAKLNENAPIETAEYVFPSHWASYYINGDASGLEPQDQKDADAAIKNIEQELGASVNCVDAEEIGFKPRNDFNNMGGDVSKYTFHVFRK